MERDPHGRQMTGEELFVAYIMSRWHKTRFPYYGEVAYRTGLYIPTIIFGMAMLAGDVSRSAGREVVKSIV